MGNNYRNYKEVSIDVNGYDKHYYNPLTKTFQYEYALFKAVSDLFGSVVCRSKCIEKLKLYFAELPDAPKTRSEGESERKKKTKEDFLDEVAAMVEKEVAGQVNFPMMHICTAEAHSILEEDGTHSFFFTDGIYGFIVHIEVSVKGQPVKIRVQNPESETEASVTEPATIQAEIAPEAEKTSGEEKKDAARNSAA